ncbi:MULTISPECIES: hypothetical protein [unclassified Ensifer]|uniref:TadE/TadG family type IV pilus assembly protein n=1 Tax=unclassified Ensifer TaxID=2633371 RepID=UPI000812D0E4|nr:MULTISPECIES: hypothetical protein [unclassified Ensifer]OCP08355.1 hypothetical protein BBX50_19805 [Ensifer sp. LC11]OCP08969.1 hypothetical protein BC374_19595 [Ensifer sp. LC13]OCP09753.1 hypothetical protein BC362_08370 [Ensifer sp. LC14]OCP32339.1 hypothetical protein BC364_19585 [Ensifer sp. LC499]
MTILNLLPFVRSASALLHCQSGNFGLLAALITIPLIAAAGVAIDFAAALNVRRHRLRPDPRPQQVRRTQDRELKFRDQ